MLAQGHEGRGPDHERTLRGAQIATQVTSKMPDQGVGTLRTGSVRASISLNVASRLRLAVKACSSGVVCMLILPSRSLSGCNLLGGGRNRRKWPDKGRDSSP